MKKQDAPRSGFDFEAAMKELEDIVKRLETGKQNLDDSLKLFERGVELARQCKQRLDEAELKVSKLVKEKEGLFRQEPFAAEE